MVNLPEGNHPIIGRPIGPSYDTLPRTLEASPGMVVLHLSVKPAMMMATVSRHQKLSEPWAALTGFDQQKYLDGLD